MLRPVYKTRSGGWGFNFKRAIPCGLVISRVRAPMLTVFGYTLADRLVEKDWNSTENAADDVVYERLESYYQVWRRQGRRYSIWRWNQSWGPPKDEVRPRAHIPQTKFSGFKLRAFTHFNAKPQSANPFLQNIS